MVDLSAPSTAAIGHSSSLLPIQNKNSFLVKWVCLQDL